MWILKATTRSQVQRARSTSRGTAHWFLYFCHSVFWVTCAFTRSDWSALHINKKQTKKNHICREVQLSSVEFTLLWTRQRSWKPKKKKKKKHGDDKIYTYIYYMASSASGHYAANSVFWLATRAGKMERYCPPGTARFVNFAKVQACARKFSFTEIIFCQGKTIFCVFSVFMEPEKASTRMKQRKQKCWWVLKIRFVTKTDTKVCFEFKNLKIWIWNLNLKCNQSNDCIFCIYPIRI